MDTVIGLDRPQLCWGAMLGTIPHADMQKFIYASVGETPVPMLGESAVFPTSRAIIIASEDM